MYTTVHKLFLFLKSTCTDFGEFVKKLLSPFKHSSVLAVTGSLIHSMYSDRICHLQILPMTTCRNCIADARSAQSFGFIIYSMHKSNELYFVYLAKQVCFPVLHIVLFSICPSVWFVNGKNFHFHEDIWIITNQGV